MLENNYDVMTEYRKQLQIVIDDADTELTKMDFPSVEKQEYRERYAALQTYDFEHVNDFYELLKSTYKSCVGHELNSNTVNLHQSMLHELAKAMFENGCTDFTVENVFCAAECIARQASELNHVDINSLLQAAKLVEMGKAINVLFEIKAYLHHESHIRATRHEPVYKELYRFFDANADEVTDLIMKYRQAGLDGAIDQAWLELPKFSSQLLGYAQNETLLESHGQKAFAKWCVHRMSV